MQQGPVALPSALLGIFLFQSLASSITKSPTFDEPVHLIAGLSYVETGQVVYAQEHPPLLREMAGLALRIVGIRWPNTPEAENRAFASTTSRRTGQKRASRSTETSHRRPRWW